MEVWANEMTMKRMDVITCLQAFVIRGNYVFIMMTFIQNKYLYIRLRCIYEIKKESNYECKIQIKVSYILNMIHTIIGQI